MKGRALRRRNPQRKHATHNRICGGICFLPPIGDGTRLFELEDYDLDGAIPALSPDQRLTLSLVIGASDIYVPDDFLDRLIGGDVRIYRRLLSEPAAKRLHLAALVGRPSPAWAAMAIAALDAGYAPDVVQNAAEGSMRSVSGDESEYWEGWRGAWEDLARSEDPRLREVARIGIERATRRRNRAMQNEEAERIYGDNRRGMKSCHEFRYLNVNW